MELIQRMNIKMLKHSECKTIFIATYSFFRVLTTCIILKVEGKGIGFAHVSSSKGFKEINRCRDLEHLLTVE